MSQKRWVLELLNSATNRHYRVPYDIDQQTEYKTLHSATSEAQRLSSSVLCETVYVRRTDKPAGEFAYIARYYDWSNIEV